MTSCDVGWALGCIRARDQVLSLYSVRGLNKASHIIIHIGRLDFQVKQPCKHGNRHTHMHSDTVNPSTWEEATMCTIMLVESSRCSNTSWLVKIIGIT